MFNKNSFIYALSDPRTNEIKYVGQTTKGMLRPNQHWRNYVWRNDGNAHKKAWIGQLKKAKIKFEIDILEYCDDFQQLNEAEIYWISYFRFIGCKLCNLTEGGVSERLLEAKPINYTFLKSKAIIDNLGNVYPSISNAAVKLEVQRSAIRRNLKGGSGMVSGYSFAYVGSVPKEPINGRLSPKPRKQRIVFDSNGIKYNSIKEASRITGVGFGYIYQILSGKIQKSKGLSFYEEAQFFKS